MKLRSKIPIRTVTLHLQQKNKQVTKGLTAHRTRAAMQKGAPGGAPFANQSVEDQFVAEARSSVTPGPMVEDNETFFR